MSELTKIQRDLALHFCSALSETLNRVSAAASEIVIADEPFSKHPTASDAACLRFRFAGSLKGYAVLVVRKAELAKLGVASILAAEEEESRLAAWLDALDPIGTQLPDLLREHGEITVAVEQLGDERLPIENVFELIRGGAEDDGRLPLHLFFDDGLVSSLHPSGVAPLNYPSAADGTASANLDLVMDVELNVTLRFGQRQLPLREVLDLTSGSVVELDRQVDEPVELVLDGRVVARGEAVIIDGNYGMRITQVLQQTVI